MKKSNKFFFLILFSIFILIPINSFPYVSGQTGRDPTIVADYLKVKLIDFDDSSPGDTKKELSYMPGGRDLLSFENMGIMEGSYNSDTNSFIVWAEATFGFEVTAWSSCLFTDMYPEIEIDAIRKVPIFHYRTWKHGQICIPFTDICECAIWDVLTYSNAINDWYYFSYREVDRGDVHNVHNHHGSIETKVWIDPGDKLSGEMTVASQTFSVPKLEAKILDLTIADMRGGECGDYEDRYTDADIDEEYVEFTLIEQWRHSITTTKVVDWLNAQEIGHHEPINLSIDPVIQQGYHDLTFKGYPFPGSNENEMTFNLPVDLQPHVTVKRQYIPYTFGSVRLYVCCMEWDGTPYVVDDVVPRDLSIHVYNMFAHYDLEVKMDLFMDCQFTGELSESFLEDPNLIISDMVWDETIWQQTPKYALPPPDLPWWIWILIILIIAIAVYIGYKLLSKLIESRKKPMQIIMRR